MLDHVFQLKPSKQYLGFMLAVLTACIAIVFYLPMGIGLKSVIFISLLIYSLHIIWHFCLLKGRNSIIKLKLERDGKWSLHTRSQHYTAEIKGNSIATTRISVLRFKLPNFFWPASCVIFPDSLKPYNIASY